MFFTRQKSRMVEPQAALPGRATPIPTASAISSKATR